MGMRYVLSCNLSQHSILSISNTVTHTHLNSLFGKIADLNEMGIRADKLFRLILKTDLNKQKIELYRRKLGIYQNENGAISSDSVARMISRGPFIAIFKHESIAFVNSLENAVRPLTERRKKRKNNKSTFTSDNTSQSSSVHQTIKSAPTDNRQNCWSRNDARSKSPKRKKIEDRSGMIIVALVDYDEISLVSVSPTNEFQQFSSDNFLQDKPLSLIDGNYKSKSKCKKLRKDRSHSSYAPSHNNGKARGNVEYEECVLLKGLTSFTKKVFRIEKKEELFEPSPERNINAS